MSGYGWGDNAINFRIMNWFGYSSENAIMLLHQNPDELIDRLLQLAESYNSLVESKRLTLAKYWLSQARLEDVEEFVLRRAL